MRGSGVTAAMRSRGTSQLVRNKLIAAALAVAGVLTFALPASAAGITCFSTDCHPGGAYTTYKMMWKCDETYNGVNGTWYTSELNDTAHNASTVVVQLWYKANDADTWHFWTAAASDLATSDGVAAQGFSGDKNGGHYADYVYWYYTATGVVWGNQPALNTFTGQNGTC